MVKNTFRYLGLRCQPYKLALRYICPLGKSYTLSPTLGWYNIRPSAFFFPINKLHAIFPHPNFLPPNSKLPNLSFPSIFSQ